ncbi:hypothetical protein Tco_1542866 [Tanacetum coccineum]
MVVQVQKHVMMQSSLDVGFKPSGEDETKITEEPRKEGDILNFMEDVFKHSVKSLTQSEINLSTFDPFCILLGSLLLIILNSCTVILITWQLTILVFLVFGKLPSIDGFDVPLPVVVCSGIANSSL